MKMLMLRLNGNAPNIDIVLLETHRLEWVSSAIPSYNQLISCTFIVEDVKRKDLRSGLDFLEWWLNLEFFR